jgi:multidrug efflux pump subunit AcrA (membrane-fusion protein)
MEKKMTQLSWIRNNFISVGIFVLIALAILLGLKNRANQKKEEMATTPVIKGSIMESVYGIGTVMAKQSFQMKSGVASTIQKLYVREGDFVKRGSPLIDLADTTLISAPFSGTVTWLPFKIGEVVFPQSEILSLVDLRSRYLVVSLEQKGALKVRSRQIARISFDSMREDSFPGRVEAIYSQGNNFLVRIGVDNLPPQILPGMTGDVAINIREKRDVLLVPTYAIREGKVTLDRGEKKPETIDVTIGLVDGEKAQVVGNLREGEVLLIQSKDNR